MARTTRAAGVETRTQWTQRRGELRRLQLVDAASELLERYEIDEISLQLVAQHAGIPVASAYHFYPDKTALFIATAKRYSEDFGTILERPYRLARTASWEDVLRIAIDRAVRYYKAHPATGRLLIDGKAPAEIKLADRMNDRSLGALLETVLDRYFVLPRFAERATVFFHAVEIVDLMFLLSMIRSKRITPRMVVHARTACFAYLREFLPATLPRRPQRRD
jgi:AcrR family transcriptional regulator